MNDIQWKAYNIGGEDGLFTITATKSGIDKNKLLSTEGEIPYVTRTDKNNGVDMFIGIEQESKYQVNEGNVISIGLDTQTVFYQSNDFYTGQNLQILSHPMLNQEIASFIIPLLEIQMKKFNWGGNGATLSRLYRTKIILPTTNNGEPNWTFMESYIKKIKLYKEDKLRIFLYDQLNIIGNYKDTNLIDAKWQSFVLGDIVSIKNGVRLTKSSMNEGIRPFIGASDSNNGITNFISNTNNSLGKNTLGINYNGSVGEGFYHPYEALFSDDVKQLNFVNGINNEFTLHFLRVSIRQQSGKFGYAYKFNSERMAKLRILLPIDSENKIDYDFMENYIKGLKAKKIQEVLKFLN